MKLTKIQDSARLYEKEMSKRFKYLKKTNVLKIDHGVVYPNWYELDLDRIKRQKDLIGWIHHISGKTWCDKDMIRGIIERVCEIKGWSIYTDHMPTWQIMQVAPHDGTPVLVKFKHGREVKIAVAAWHKKRVVLDSNMSTYVEGRWELTTPCWSDVVKPIAWAAIPE